MATISPQEALERIEAIESENARLRNRLQLSEIVAGGAIVMAICLGSYTAFRSPIREPNVVHKGVALQQPAKTPEAAEGEHRVKRIVVVDDNGSEIGSFGSQLGTGAPVISLTHGDKFIAILANDKGSSIRMGSHGSKGFTEIRADEKGNPTVEIIDAAGNSTVFQDQVVTHGKQLLLPQDELRSEWLLASGQEDGFVPSDGMKDRFKRRVIETAALYKTSNNAIINAADIMFMRLGPKKIGFTGIESLDALYDIGGKIKTLKPANLEDVQDLYAQFRGSGKDQAAAIESVVGSSVLFR